MQAKLLLDPAAYETIKALIEQWMPGVDVWAYGSRVKGLAHDLSDLDLVIRNRQNLEQPTPHLASLKQKFQESDLPILVDVMDWAYLPETYREEIQQTYVPFMVYTERRAQ